MKDVGLSTGRNLGVENPMIPSLNDKSIIATMSNMASRNTVALCLIKLLKCLSEFLQKKLIISIGYILFVITISYIAQMP